MNWKLLMGLFLIGSLFSCGPLVQHPNIDYLIVKQVVLEDDGKYHFFIEGVGEIVEFETSQRITAGDTLKLCK